MLVVSMFSNPLPVLDSHKRILKNIIRNFGMWKRYYFWSNRIRTRKIGFRPASRLRGDTTSRQSWYLQIRYLEHRSQFRASYRIPGWNPTTTIDLIENYDGKLAVIAPRSDVCFCRSKLRWIRSKRWDKISFLEWCDRNFLVCRVVRTGPTMEAAAPKNNPWIGTFRRNYDFGGDLILGGFAESRDTDNLKHFRNFC